MELEQQLAQAKQQDSTDGECMESKITKVGFIIYYLTLVTSAAANSSAPEKEAQLKSHYERLLLGAQKDLESQKDQVTRTQQELKAQRDQV